MDKSAQELLITRLVDFPREIVFEAWTSPDDLQAWFAPKGCTIHFEKLDLRQGGNFHWCVRSVKYPDCWCTGTFLQIKYPALIQYKIRLSDQQGKPVDAASVFKDENWPEETIVTVIFKELGDKTELIIKQTVSEGLAKKTGAYQGWEEMLDVLSEHLIKM